MKIAFPTNDGININPHFGQATHYLFVTLTEAGPELSRNLQPKPSHVHHPGPDHHSHHHGHDHANMFEPLKACDIVIAGGMGQPAYQAITQLNVQLILTQERNIDAALQAYRHNTLENTPTLVHAPGHHH